MKNLFLTIASLMFFGTAMAQDTPKQNKSSQDTVQEHLAKKKRAAAKKADTIKKQKDNTTKVVTDPAVMDTVSGHNSKRKNKK